MVNRHINSERAHPHSGGRAVVSLLALLGVALASEYFFPTGGDERRSLPPLSSNSDDLKSATGGSDRGRRATTPSEIPALGWKDILLRVYANLSKHRIMGLAAGMTYYSILAIFPAIAALVAVYGLFSDPSAIAKHLDQLGGFLPGGALEVARDQLTRVASKGSQTLGLTFLVGLGFSLWSANAAMKSLFDTLNIVHNEEEKRGIIKLNAISLLFTVGGVIFVVAALGSIVVVPVILDYVGLSQGGDLLLRAGRWPVMFLVLTFALAIIYRYGPSRNSAVALDYVGQRDRGPALAVHFGIVFLVCGQLWKVQRDLRVTRCRYRLHDVALDFSDRHLARRGDRRRNGAPDGSGHDHGGTKANGCARRANGGYRRFGAGGMIAYGGSDQKKAAPNGTTFWWAKMVTQPPVQFPNRFARWQRAFPRPT